MLYNSNKAPLGLLPTVPNICVTINALCNATHYHTKAINSPLHTTLATKSLHDNTTQQQIHNITITCPPYVASVNNAKIKLCTSHFLPMSKTGTPTPNIHTAFDFLYDTI